MIDATDSKVKFISLNSVFLLLVSDLKKRKLYYHFIHYQLLKDHL